jgi:alkaline phosphatase D
VDYENPNAPTVATEFVGTSISSTATSRSMAPYYGPMIQINPNIRFFDGDRRGYVLCTLDHEQWRTDLRMVSTVSTPDAPVSTFASFVVEDGQPGAQQL